MECNWKSTVFSFTLYFITYLSIFDRIELVKYTDFETQKIDIITITFNY